MSAEHRSSRASARLLRGVAPALTAAILLIGCAAEPPAEHGPAPEPGETVDTMSGPVQPVGTPETIVTGLAAPWSMLRLASGSTLISERDSARILELTVAGELREVGAVDGTAPRGEGGLLGLAALDGDAGLWLYAYLTTPEDNRVVRYALEGDAGGYGLGVREVILSGLPRAGFHNGGRIAFGPDGMLYVTAGDAGQTGLAQDPSSPAGKLLRLTPEGAPAPGNPTEGSPVYSLGHRNPQGIAWDGEGRLWAAEFGQDTWDELNLIEPGANYGWPVVEGVGGDAAYTDPVLQWDTDTASPSGLAQVRGTLFLAGLGGERLFAIYPQPDGTAEAVEHYAGEFGRIRDVAAGPDGTLWLLTNNTDGRGAPREGDDRIVQITLAPRTEG